MCTRCQAKRRRLNSSMPLNHFITYATHEFLPLAKQLRDNALQFGFDDARVYTPADIENSSFYRQNLAILSRARGAGYWLWKPYLIREQLKMLAHPDDVLMYCDAGRSTYYQFTKHPEKLFELARKSSQGFVLPPTFHLGQVKHWTKRDCLILMDCDREPFLSHGQISATWSLWRKTPSSMNFLDEWLEYCQDSRCLTDDPNTCGEPNHAAFIDHRHDQAILTLLALKYGVPVLDFAQTWTHTCLNLKPGSALVHHFYKRPGNVDDLLSCDNPLLLIKEFVRFKRCNASTLKQS